jgi:hypothetical protein
MKRSVSALSTEHTHILMIADKLARVNYSVLGILEKALGYVRGQRKRKEKEHTSVEVYKAEESIPNFRVFVTTTEEGDHAVAMLRGSKVTVTPLFKEAPGKLIWHIEILRKEIPGLEVEVVTREAAENDL